MKQLISIIILSLLLAATDYMAEAKKKRAVETSSVDTIDATVVFVPNVTIHTPTTEIYGDAVDIVRYEGYSVFDLNNNEILTIMPSQNRPVRLRLETGNYLVKLEEQKSPVFRISVLENQYNEFVINETNQ